MSGKVKISAKEEGGRNASQYGYQGNLSARYGYDPFLNSYYDDEVAVDESAPIPIIEDLRESIGIAVDKPVETIGDEVKEKSSEERTLDSPAIEAQKSQPVQAEEAKVNPAPVTEESSTPVAESEMDEKESIEVSIKGETSIDDKKSDDDSDAAKPRELTTEDKKPKVEGKSSKETVTKPSRGANVETAEGGGAVPAEGAKGKPEKLQADTSNSESYVKSLTSASPSSLVEGMTHADADIADARQNEKDELKESLPEIDQPTGLAIKEGKAKENKGEEKNAKVPDVKVQGKEDGKKINEAHQVPAAKPIQIASPQGKDGKANLEEIKKFVQRLPVSDNDVNTSAGPRPNVDLSGQANPSQNTENVQLAENEVSRLKTESDTERAKPMGENEIFPELELEKLKPETPLSPSAEYALDTPIETPEMDAQMMAAFDEQGKASVQEQTAAEMAKAEDAKATMEADSAKERTDNELKIQEETVKTEQAQLTEQKKAKAEVDSHRADWKKESEDLQSEFKIESESKRKEAQGKIDSEVSTTNTKVDAEFIQAENKAKEAKTQAKTDAQAQKNEVENKKPGFWDKVSGAISRFFDKVKAKLNEIFQKLRELVKAVIEAAKKAVNTLIDLARKAIIGFIKAFGELLKALVSVLLSQFPGLKKKFCDLIDKAVNLACEAVNKLAEALKKAVNFLLDVLGKVLDTILAVYQAIYNAILDAVKFIVVGLIEIMKGITNIVISIGYGVMAVKGALVKEFIGEDVTAPLPNVEATEEELPKLMEMKELYIGGGKENVSEAAMEEEVTLMKQTRLKDEDFVLENTIDLDPELIKSLPPMQEGMRLELGGIPNPVTAEDVSNEVFGQQNTENTSTRGAEFGPNDEKTSGIGSSIGAAGVDMEWLAKSDDEKLQWHLDQMDASADMPNPKESKGADAGAETQSMPLETKTGHLGVMKRLGFVGSQMMKGMAMWWNQNRMAVYAGLAAVLLVGGIVAFFTGGAGLIALLQLMLQAMTVFFIAEAVWRIKNHVFDWLGKAWKGDVKGGGESLAMAFAVLFSEFLFEYVLKGVGKVLKKLKKSMKATKLGKKVSRMMRKATVFTTKAYRRITKPLRGIAKRGKNYVLKLRRGLAKGAKKLDDLRERILKKFGFKGMWLEKHGKYIELWAEFNPEFMIGRGTAEEKTIHADNRFHGSNNNTWRQSADGSYEVRLKDSDEWIPAHKMEGSEAIDIPAKYETGPDGKVKKIEHKRTKDSKGDKKKIKELGDTRKTKKTAVEALDADPKIQEIKRKKDAGEPLTPKEEALYSDYKVKRNQVSVASRDIGEAGAEAAMTKQFPEHKKVLGGVDSPNQSGVFDQVYKKEGPPVEFIIVEAKGGNADVGSAVVDTADGVKRAEQGTREYMDHIIEQMRKKGMDDLADELVLNKKRIKYMKAQTKIGDSGEILDTVLTTFKLN